MKMMLKKIGYSSLFLVGCLVHAAKSELPLKGKPAVSGQDFSGINELMRRFASDQIDSQDLRKELNKSGIPNATPREIMSSLEDDIAVVSPALNPVTGKRQHLVICKSFLVAYKEEWQAWRDCKKFIKDSNFRADFRNEHNRKIKIF